MSSVQPRLILDLLEKNLEWSGDLRRLNPEGLVSRSETSNALNRSGMEDFSDGC